MSETVDSTALFLEIDGRLARNELRDNILQASVEESLHVPGMFTLVLNPNYTPGKESNIQYENEFTIGKSIKIGFQGGENRDYVLEGEITEIETNFTSNSQTLLIVRGYDISHRLWRGRYNRSFQNMSDTDIVNRIAMEVGIPTGTIDQTGGPYGYGDIKTSTVNSSNVNSSNGYVFQENQTNLEFLRERAARNGFELFVQDGKLNFRKPKANETLELQWLKNLDSFRVKVNSAEQVKEVEVRGWDYSQKRAIVETANREQVLTQTGYGQGSQTSTSFKGKPPTPKMIVVNQPIFNSLEAKTMAQALCNELGEKFVQADGKAKGNPKIRPGRLVNLQGIGKHSGSYYITETHHLFQEGVYTTGFSVKTGDILSLLSPKTHYQPEHNLLVGIVTDNKDPNGWGRVRVKFPTLTEECASYWAPVVTTGAGFNRGLDCLPEINDEVLVAFAHGDIHRPYVIGGVWNGKDKPPEPVSNSVMDGKVRLRTFKTSTGHTLQFVEEDKGASRKGVYLDTVYGHHLHLNDTDQFIELKTKDGHQIRLDDKNKRIQINSTGTIEIKGKVKINEKEL